MKVYIMTEVSPFNMMEVFVDVKSTKKKAEKAFRERYPHMKNFEESSPGHFTSVSGSSIDMSLFITEKELD